MDRGPARAPRGNTCAGRRLPCCVWSGGETAGEPGGGRRPAAPSGEEGPWQRPPASSAGSVSELAFLHSKPCASTTCWAASAGHWARAAVAAGDRHRRTARGGGRGRARQQGRGRARAASAARSAACLRRDNVVTGLPRGTMRKRVTTRRHRTDAPRVAGDAAAPARSCSGDGHARRSSRADTPASTRR